jgi:hypothetical protein
MLWIWYYIARMKVNWDRGTARIWNIWPVLQKRENNILPPVFFVVAANWWQQFESRGSNSLSLTLRWICHLFWQRKKTWQVHLRKQGKWAHECWRTEFPREVLRDMDVQHPLCKGNSQNFPEVLKEVVSFQTFLKHSWPTDADNDSRDPSTEKQGMSIIFHFTV